MALTLNNKNINLGSIVIEDVHMDDYPDFVDAFVSYLEFDDCLPMNDNELIQFSEENEGIVNELIHENSLFI